MICECELCGDTKTATLFYPHGNMNNPYFLCEVCRG